MHDTSESFDPLRLPLKGTQLIEASAGTGKTFTIITLYLRLLLGLAHNASLPSPLSVKNLLVMTFTENATAELRGRIRENIHNLRIACLRQRTDNSLYQSLLDAIPDKQRAAKCLLLAERHMDEAAIFTIHAFCQHILNIHAFELGIPNVPKLIEDESKLRYQACADFWRRNYYSLPREIAEAVYAEWKGPAGLLSFIDRYLHGDLPLIKSLPLSKETLISRYEKVVHQIIKLKKKWVEVESDIVAIIEKSDIDRRKFSRNNQKQWIEKIYAWAKQKTRNYQLPDALGKFSQRFLETRTKHDGVVPEHPLFIAIDEILSASLSFNDLMFSRALTEIREIIACEKQRRAEWGFEDVLSRFDEVLRSKKGEGMAEGIRVHFPVAMIDEFQDTDPTQYRIFCRIWKCSSKTAMLFIGDPKQAIYSFRGADIFTYMKARSEVEALYTLNTNWRSATGMVNSVNTLFSRIDTPFIFKEIPFLSIKAIDRNASLRFEWNGKLQPAMCFWLIDGEGCGVKDYQIFMAQQSAAQIHAWLRAGEQNKALLWQGDTSQPVKASDISVLVRSRQEAVLMSDALARLGIHSVYLSNHDSVFDTLEAQEILYLLQAVLFPEQEGMLRCALATSILGLSVLEIDFFNNNGQAWEGVIAEFNDYRELWKKYGVMAMFRELITRRQIAENILASPGGERRLTDILHISEMLQESSFQLENEAALIRWLAEHIYRPNSNFSNQQMRLESDENLVKIVTIHKSKGLEYPLVWLPFIASYRLKNQAYYHDRVSFDPILDLRRTPESMKLSEAERLAEDLRLLYVGLTRSVWHCSLGVAPLFLGQGSKTGTTDLHYSAIGYLIQKGEEKDAVGLRLAIESFCNKDIALHISSSLPPDNARWELKRPMSPALEARSIHRTIVNDWRISSYSELRQEGQISAHEPIPKLDIDGIGSSEVIEQEARTPHQFPRSASSGRFLHGLLEDLDFTQAISKNWILEMLKKSGYEASWQPMLSQWILEILKVPLTDMGLSLNQLSIKEKQTELKFYLPINGSLRASVLDELMRKYDPISKMCPPLDFRQISGMLKGYIDLVFRHGGRYYLMDYKSNWLGKNREAYTKEAMQAAMCSHRYDLQYQLYTLSLHRYLRQRIMNYRYETHFGGVIYLFLRGVGAQDSSFGIFSIRPLKALIDEIDRLFSNPHRI